MKTIKNVDIFNIDEGDLIWEKFNNIIPLMIPDTKIQRCYRDGNPFFITFSKEEIKSIKKNYKGDHKIWITRIDRPNIPSGSLVTYSNFALSMEFFQINNNRNRG